MATIANPSANFAAEIIDNGKASKQQFLVIGLCLFLNMLDGFDITTMSIVNTAVGAELDLTPDRLGLISSSNVYSPPFRYFWTQERNYWQCIYG